MYSQNHSERFYVIGVCWNVMVSSRIVIVSLVGVFLAVLIGVYIVSQEGIDDVDVSDVCPLSLTTVIGKVSDGVQSGNVTVYFIDAGVGDSIFVDTSDKDVLIDAGERHDGEFIASFLVSINVTKIDYLIASHPHFDHIGGLVTVMERFSSLGIPIHMVIENGQDRNTDLYREFRSYANEIGVTLAERCQIYQLDSETEMVIVSPPQPLLYSNHCENSIVQMIKFRDISFLLTGDIEPLSEAEIVESALNIQAEILKVSHHGGGTSSTPSFLSAVGPEVAVITVGAENQNGHPHQDVLDRLEDVGANIYRTDLQSTISITTDGVNYSIKTKN